MKKLGFYAVIVAALVFTLWFCTKDGLRPSEGAAPPEGSVGSVTLESLSMGRRVSVENGEDIERLSGVLSTLSEENGMVVDLEEDFPEHMRDWSLEWLSPQGESLALVEISRVGTVFRGDQCFNFLGGEIFDMDYLRGLLLGLPDMRESQQPIDIESIGRANLSSSGDTVVISGEAVDELKDILRGMNFYQRGKDEYGASGGYSLELFDADERTLGTLFLWGDQAYINNMEGNGFDEEWAVRMFETMPEATYSERYPIVDFKYDEDLIEFSISDGMAADETMVRITDPELMERLEGPVREMEFKACEPYDSGELKYWINRYFADDFYAFAIKIVDEESIEFGGWLYKLMDGKKFDMELYAQLADPEGPYKDHPGVMYWKEGDPPLPQVTPRPSPSPSGEPEPTPAGTARPHTMDDPPDEKVFDLDGGHILMTASDGNTVAVKGDEMDAIAKELSGLRFQLREECTLDSYCMHVQQEDKERYHGNPLFTLTWYDSNGYKQEEFTARGIKGWIDYNGWYYQAENGGIDMENLKRLDKEMPNPAWYEWQPMYTLREDISEAKSLWITDESEDWAAVITDPELLERISRNIEGMEFFADTQGSRDEGYTYELEWYKGVLGPFGGRSGFEWIRVKDRQRVMSGGDCYKLREGEIDMDLLDELTKPDGEYSDRKGVRLVKMEDLVQENKSD